MMIDRQSQGSASPTSLALHHSGEEKIMIESRYHELLAAELRIGACGCGGACRACQNEPRPGSEERDEQTILSRDLGKRLGNERDKAMDTNTLTETFTLVSGYDHKTVSTFRRFTIEDIKNIRGEQYIIDKRGEYRRCRPNGSVKTWKRDPMRFECSFKCRGYSYGYGGYEYFRLNTQEMLQQLVVMV